MEGTNPVSNVDVVLEDTDGNQFTGKTGSAGGCTISNVPEGSYSVMASKTGYAVYAGNITGAIVCSRPLALRGTLVLSIRMPRSFSSVAPIYGDICPIVIPQRIPRPLSYLRHPP